MDNHVTEFAPDHPSLLPTPLRHSALAELARVFCTFYGRPSYDQLRAFGFPKLEPLLQAGWVMREPGRWSATFRPGHEVRAEMWRLDPTLCQVLNLPLPVEPSPGA